MKPQDFAQYKKAGRGFLITRNSATLADTDYENVAKEIVSALNDRKRLVAALREADVQDRISRRIPNDLETEISTLLRELGERS